VRAPLVLLTALSVPLIFLLVCRIYGWVPGVAAALLIGLDPWFTGHSRILHHDANLTALMTVSALALINALPDMAHQGQRTARWGLPLAGFCAGAAVLCKTLGIFLLPWTVFVLAVAVASRRLRAGEASIQFLVWLGTASLTLLLLWPALWLNPGLTFQRMLEMMLVYAENPHESGQFWFGAVVADPGPLFYVVVLGFITTPILALGLTAKLVELLGRLREFLRSRRLTAPLLAEILLWVYVFGYLAMITFGEKKHERYALPAVEMLNVLGGLGLAAALSSLRCRAGLGGRLRAAIVPGGLAVLLLAQGAMLAGQAPYYFTYYNPLLGGTPVAARSLLVGIGEGNEVAAAYLDRLPNATGMSAVASLANVVAPFFRGQTGLWQPQAAVFAADYLVLYRREQQLGLPDVPLLDFITANWPLLKTVTINGVPYAWVYAAPAADWVRAGFDTGPIMPELLAYKWEGGRLHLFRQFDPRAETIWSVRSPAEGQTAPALWQLEKTVNSRAVERSEIRPVTRTNGEAVMALQELIFTSATNRSSDSGALKVEIGILNPATQAMEWWPLPAQQSAQRE
jgi:4-amino-4-deoxy-L-arabinose transferase-like glycosyltransferase